MNNCRIEYKNNEVIFSSGQQVVGSRSPSKNDFTKFREWIGSYNRALKQLDIKEILLTIGREIYAWLNGEQNFLEKILQNAENPFIIEFQIPKRSKEVQKAFIEVPWELLADKTGHLAKDATLKFSPVRRIGRENEIKPEPSEYILNTVFIAASPRNVKPELAYEQEESAILNLHTRNSLDMDLFVEESGELDQLTRLVHDRKPVDVVHISCHGNIFKDLDNKNNSPYICLEDFTGNLNRMEPDSFCRKFSQNRPGLTFLSACKTAESHLNQSSSEDETFWTFAHVLIEQGFPAVLGWSGSVKDSETTRFASCLYRELTQSSTIENAVALSRSLLFVPPREEKREYESGDWHLARLYLGPDGGGILSKGKKIRFDYKKDASVKKFLGKKEKGLEVASRKEFVGRRRKIQDILKEFKENNHAGILIHGLGNQGKSSLAARIANRMYDHDIVLIYGKKGEERLYSARHVLNEFKTVSSHIETEKRIDELLPEVTRDESLLRASLKELLEDPFSGRDEDHRAILMVVDDLEKILTKPEGDSKLYGVGIDYRTTLISIISAFKEAKTKSRLLLTSRYDFDLIDDSGCDICGNLLKLPLTAMNDTEAEKQYFVKYGEMAVEKEKVKLEPARVMKACKGNPGLQDTMFSLFIHDPKSYQKALGEMEAYLAGGDLPEEQTVQKFLRDLALDTIFSLLTNGEKELLRFATLFDIPVPEAVFDALKEGFIKKSVDYKKRLVGFGLFERYEDFVDPHIKSLQINPIAMTRIEKAPFDSIGTVAGRITETLLTNWCGDKEVYRPWVCDREIVKFGLIAKNTEAIRLCAENCVQGMNANLLTVKAADFAMRSIAFLETNKEKSPVGLYQIASDVCHQTGKVNLARKYIEKTASFTTSQK